MNATVGDAEYCCVASASLFHGNLLSWYNIACKYKPITIPKKFDKLKNALTMYLSVIDEAKKMHNKLKGLVKTETVDVYMSAFEFIALYISNATDSELLEAFVWGV